MHAYPEVPAGWEGLAKKLVNAKVSEGPALVNLLDQKVSDGTPFPDGRMCAQDRMGLTLPALKLTQSFRGVFSAPPPHTHTDVDLTPPGANGGIEEYMTKRRPLGAPAHSGTGWPTASLTLFFSGASEI